MEPTLPARRPARAVGLMLLDSALEVGGAAIFGLFGIFLLGGTFNC